MTKTPRTTIDNLFFLFKITLSHVIDKKAGVKNNATAMITINHYDYSTDIKCFIKKMTPVICQ